MSMLRLVVLGLVIVYIKFVAWLGLWAGSVLFFGTLLIISLTVVAKPSNDVGVYE